MSRGADLPSALRALIDAATSVVRASSSGRVMEARLGHVLDLDAVHPRARTTIEEALARTTEPLSAKDVERICKDAWGSAPGKVLDDFDPEPIAVRPSAQVHKGELDGAAVAIKVRRPGLARSARNDLSLIDSIAPALGRVLSSADTGKLLRELRERIGDELDLETEASGQRQAGRALKRMESVRVPAVHGDLCNEDVMVSELLQGPTLLEAKPDDPGHVARTLLAAHLTLWREAGIAPTDPRPAHVILCPDGTLGLLGLGLQARIEPARLDAIALALTAMRAGDEARFEQAVTALQILPPGEAAPVLPLIRGVLGELIAGPAKLDAPALERLADRGIDALGELMPLAARVTPTASDLWPLRGLAQLAVVLARLGATEDWVEQTAVMAT